MKIKTMFDTRLIQKIFLLLALVSIQKVSAQDIESLIKTYPNDLAVMTIYKRELKLSVQKNQPYGQSKEDVEMVMLNDRVNGMYNKYNVYHGSFDELKQMEAYTKVPDGNKYKKIKVAETKTQNAESRSVFYDDVQETTFDFPALMKGSIASVSHTVLHKDIHMLSPFYFMSYMPIVSASYTVTFPSDMDVRYIIRNNNNNTISVKEDLSGNQHSFVFTANNIPLTERFSNAPGVSYYEPHVIVYVASYTNDDNQQVTVFNTLKDFYKWNYSFLKGINEDQSELIKHLADSLTEKLATPIAKAKAIYQWVQEHIKYVAFENGLEGFVPRQAKDVCTKRYGDCKDMSSLITALLRAVDLKGYYTWIGTRDIAYDYDDVHLPMTDNHMISTLNIGDEWLFLDGTDPNCVFGMPSEAIQGKQALLAIDGDNYKVIRVPEVDADKNKIIDSTFINLTDKGIQGNMSVYYSGYFGSNIYNTLQYKDPKDIKEYVKYKMSKASNKFILGDYSINDIDKGQKFINIKAGFEVPDYGKKIGDEFYINLNLEKIFSNANIDTAKRKIASDNSYKYVIDEYSILSIPDNYKVNYLPSNVSIDKGAYSFLIQYTQEAKRVIAKLEVRSNNLWMQPSEFSTWNTALKELINHYKEQVVLQKK